MPEVYKGADVKGEDGLAEQGEEDVAGPNATEG